MRIGAIVGAASGMLSSIAAALPSETQIDAAGKLPLVVVLGAVCCYCVWVIYRQGIEYGKRLDNLADALRNLAEELSERPCIRKPNNG